MTDSGGEPSELPVLSPDDPGYADWLERVAFSPAEVDRIQILEHLRRTPSERLAVLERVVNARSACGRTG